MAGGDGRAWRLAAPSVGRISHHLWLVSAAAVIPVRARVIAAPGGGGGAPPAVLAAEDTPSVEWEVGE